MKKVLAAVDSSPAVTSVLAAARAVATLLDAEVEAVHVHTDGERTARSAAEAAGVPFTALAGPVVERLAEAGSDPRVVAVTIGARGTRAGARVLGGTASAVATALEKPVVIVPPDATPPAAIRRVLVPLEGNEPTSRAPRGLIEPARGSELEVIVLHIHELESFPLFSDQLQHERPAWAKEFLERYCPWGIESTELETRVGRAGELVPVVADESGCDLIALGWSRRLEQDRAPVVRETLARTHVPVALVPVVHLDAEAEEADAPAAAGVS